jgi:hypothetical protein
MTKKRHPEVGWRAKIINLLKKGKEVPYSKNQLPCASFRLCTTKNSLILSIFT